MLTYLNRYRNYMLPANESEEAGRIFADISKFLASLKTPDIQNSSAPKANLNERINIDNVLTLLRNNSIDGDDLANIKRLMKQEKYESMQAAFSDNDKKLIFDVIRVAEINQAKHYITRKMEELKDSDVDTKIISALTELSNILTFNDNVDDSLNIWLNQDSKHDKTKKNRELLGIEYDTNTTLLENALRPVFSRFINDANAKKIVSENKEALDSSWRWIAKTAQHADKNPILFVNAMIYFNQEIVHAIRKNSDNSIEFIEPDEIQSVYATYLDTVDDIKMPTEQAKQIMSIQTAAMYFGSAPETVNFREDFAETCPAIDVQETCHALICAASPINQKLKTDDGTLIERLPIEEEDIHHGTEQLKAFFKQDLILFKEWKKDSKLPWWCLRSKLTKNIDNAVKEYDKLVQKMNSSTLTDDQLTQIIDKAKAIKHATDNYTAERTDPQRYKRLASIQELQRNTAEKIDLLEKRLAKSDPSKRASFTEAKHEESTSTFDKENENLGSALDLYNRL